jgi:cytochrome c553
MRLFAISALFVVGASSLAQAYAPSIPSCPPAMPRLINYCNGCHGGHGNSPVYPAPRIAGQNAEYIANQLVLFQARGRDNPLAHSSMWIAARDPDLTADGIAAIAAYYSKQVSTPRPSWMVNQDLAAKGKNIYMNGFPDRGVLACVGCHGAEGLGAASIPSLARQNPAYIRRQFQDWKNGYRAAAGPMPAFAKALHDDEIEALTEFFYSL